MSALTCAGSGGAGGPRRVLAAPRSPDATVVGGGNGSLTKLTRCCLLQATGLLHGLTGTAGAAPALGAGAAVAGAAVGGGAFSPANDDGREYDHGRENWRNRVAGGPFSLANDDDEEDDGVRENWRDRDPGRELGDLYPLWRVKTEGWEPKSPLRLPSPPAWVNWRDRNN